MKIKFIYGIIPVPVFYVDSLGKAAGRSNGFIIRVVKEYKSDKGLLEHELQHCRQFYRTLAIHAFLYKFSKKYRYKAEIEAYKIQLKYCENKDASAKKFANFLATNYSLDVSEAEALSDLK
jgi:hypothetical protein